MIENPDRYADVFCGGRGQFGVGALRGLPHLDGTLEHDPQGGRDGGSGAESGHAGFGAGRRSGSGGLRASDERESRIRRTEVDSVRPG